MRKFSALICFFFILQSTLLFADDDFIEAGRAATIDYLLERAIAHKIIAGGIVIIGNRDGVIYSTTRGRLSPAADAPTPDEHTIYDIASLTKVLATTPAIMKLIEDGKLNLNDSIARWFPDFEKSGREDITILTLLTHTSGLQDMTLHANDSINSVITRAATQKKLVAPGKNFRYADINFILLGELVNRISGSPLDKFCNSLIYKPLETKETMFLPSQQTTHNIAPTLGVLTNELSSGSVQDGNSKQLGGIAGHAGLFSSTADITKFARLILNGGTLNGKRIFTEQTIAQMTTPHFYSNGAIIRGLGWDIKSSYSAPKGSIFSAMSFGHTGYSGSSIWIDPQKDLFVIMLTTRLNYHNIKTFNRLRRDVSTIAAAVFKTAGNEQVKATNYKSL